MSRSETAALSEALASRSAAPESKALESKALEPKAPEPKVPPESRADPEPRAAGRGSAAIASPESGSSYSRPRPAPRRSQPKPAERQSQSSRRPHERLEPPVLLSPAGWTEGAPPQVSSSRPIRRVSLSVFSSPWVSFPARDLRHYSTDPSSTSSETTHYNIAPIEWLIYCGNYVFDNRWPRRDAQANPVRVGGKESGPASRRTQAPMRSDAFRQWGHSRGNGDRGHEESLSAAAPRTPSSIASTIAIGPTEIKPKCLKQAENRKKRAGRIAVRAARQRPTPGGPMRWAAQPEDCLGVGAFLPLTIVALCVFIASFPSLDRAIRQIDWCRPSYRIWLYETHYCGSL
mgnify:CR=1 FL=1